jgi:GxxExxY protein
MPCLQFELATAGLRFVTQRPVPILYKGIELDGNYRIDLLVENLVVVEIKAIEQLMPVHQAQVLTYVRLLGCPGGLLINFNVPKLIDGVKLMNPRADGGERHRRGTSVSPLLL